MPGQVMHQASQWCEEAVLRARGDAEAARLLAWTEEAHAFSTLNRVEFLRRYPRHADSVERIKEAVAFAEDSFADPSDRQRFVEQARRRLTDRIAEGRADAVARRTEKNKDRGPRTR